MYSGCVVDDGCAQGVSEGARKHITLNGKHRGFWYIRDLVYTPLLDIPHKWCLWCILVFVVLVLLVISCSLDAICGIRSAHSYFASCIPDA